MQELRIFDKTESTGSLVSSPEVLTVHADNSGSLSCTTTVNCKVKTCITDLH